jgi:hypothetical protein
VGERWRNIEIHGRRGEGTYNSLKKRKQRKTDKKVHRAFGVWQVNFSKKANIFLKEKIFSQ